MSEERLSGMSLVATVGELRDLCERLTTGFAELNRQNGALRNRLSDYECLNCEDSRDVCLCDEEDLAEDDCDHSILYCQKCGSLMLRGWCPTCSLPEVLVEMVTRADSDARVARLEAELTELKGLFQRTHGCDVSWPREADRLKSELAIATQHGRNLVARVDGDGGHKQLCETLEESTTRADEAIARLQSTVTSLRASAELLRDLTPYLRRHLVDDVTLPIGEGPDGSPMALQLQSWFVRLTKLEQGEPDPEIAKLRELVGLESLVRATLKERIDSLSPRRETPWWHATWLSTQPGLYGTAVNRAQGATLFDLMREILKKESGE